MSKAKSPKREVQNQEQLKVLRFVEELSWLLSSHSGIDFKALPRYLKPLLEPAADPSQSVGGYVSTNPNKHFLVGVLPRILVDSELFATNDDIAEFASSVMGVLIPRFHKKSRYELIGHIVCQTDALNDTKLRNLAKALDLLVSKGESMRQLILQRRKANFDWNDVVQSLANEVP